MFIVTRRIVSNKAHKYILLLLLAHYWHTVYYYTGLTLSSLSSENVSTMIPNTMFSPMVVTMMKKEMSKSSRRPATCHSFGISGITWSVSIVLCDNTDPTHCSANVYVSLYQLALLLFDSQGNHHLHACSMKTWVAMWCQTWHMFI